MDELLSDVGAVGKVDVVLKDVPVALPVAGGRVRIGAGRGRVGHPGRRHDTGGFACVLGPSGIKPFHLETRWRKALRNSPNM